MKPSDAVAKRVKELRTKRGWSAQQLADQCKEAGASDLTASVIANIEAGRRDADGRRRRLVSVEELVVLAYVLGAPLPVLLMVDTDERLEVTPTVDIHRGSAVLWAAGEMPLDSPGLQYWNESAAPLALYRGMHKAFRDVARAASRGGERFDEALSDLALVVNLMTEVGQPPFALPREWVDRMRELGLLDRPDEVPIQDQDDG